MQQQEEQQDAPTPQKHPQHQQTESDYSERQEESRPGQQHEHQFLLQDKQFRPKADVRGNNSGGKWTLEMYDDEDIMTDCGSIGRGSETGRPGYAEEDAATGCGA
jgi:hypothetical protein